MKKIFITISILTLATTTLFAGEFQPQVQLKACGTQNEILLPSIAANAADSGITLHSNKGYAGYNLTCTGTAGKKLSANLNLTFEPVDIAASATYTTTSFPAQPTPGQQLTFTANNIKPQSASSMLTFTFPDQCFGGSNDLTILNCNIERTAIQ